jgi:hypothetical protein
MRKIIVVAAALLLLAGCDKPSDKDKNIVHMNMPMPNNAMPMPGDTMHAPPPPFVPPPDIVIGQDTADANALFSLSHELTVTSAHDAVPKRFQVARDACLKVKALKCILTSASLTTARTVSAQLQVAMPHDAVAVFEKTLMNPVREDGDIKAEITSRSTTVENQTRIAADTERKLAQAIVYRDKLEALAKRDNLTVEEVLKIHEALTEAQSAVENAMAAKRASDSDIRLEKLNITLEEKIIPVQVSGFDHFWQNARDVIVTSTAEMLLRIINALPWLPIALLLAWLAARFVKRLRIRRPPAA